MKLREQAAGRFWMTEQAYEYQGLLASTWDLLRGDTSQWPDRVFYREVIRQAGEPALDVGCGTGRLLLDYMADGVDVDGVDNSPEMLALCGQKAEKLGLKPNLYEQEMASLALPRRYRTIIVPSCSFQLVTDKEEAVEAISRFYEHLEAGGALAISFFRISWDEGAVLETNWELLAEVTRPEDGAVVRKWSSFRYEVTAQLQHTRDRYEVWLKDEKIAFEERERSPAVRFYTQAQVRQLFAEVGFVDVQIYRGSEWELASVKDGRFTAVGKRPL
jgi:ubiquinone/menaquinone biosynthesis C-methylase UbiE